MILLLHWLLWFTHFNFTFHLQVCFYLKYLVIIFMYNTTLIKIRYYYVFLPCNFHLLYNIIVSKSTKRQTVVWRSFEQTGFLGYIKVEHIGISTNTYKPMSNSNFLFKAKVHTFLTTLKTQPPNCNFMTFTLLHQPRIK